MNQTEPHDRTLAVEGRALRKVYAGSAVVDGVDLAIPRRGCWGLLGPNGAGKTTLLRMLLGKTPPSGGTLTVLGHPVPARAGAARVRIGVVPQHDALDPDFGVEEGLRVYGAYFGLSGTALDRRIDELIEFAALGARRRTPVGKLSGGMQRRLSLSRALINDPELLVLDEPTTGLDPQARQLIWQRLRELVERGITLIVTTHYMEEAERLCTRVTVMDHGRLLDSDSPAALVRRHIEPQVVEVRGPGLEDWHRGSSAALAARCEHVGDTRYYYAADAGALLGALADAGHLIHIHRPANLEDVFLRLTGRDLRDG